MVEDLRSSNGTRLEGTPVNEPTRLPVGVVIEKVVVGDDERTAGTVFVPFSHLGHEDFNTTSVPATTKA